MSRRGPSLFESDSDDDSDLWRRTAAAPSPHDSRARPGSGGLKRNDERPTAGERRQLTFASDDSDSMGRHAVRPQSAGKVSRTPTTSNARSKSPQTAPIYGDVSPLLRKPQSRPGSAKTVRKPKVSAKDEEIVKLRKRMESLERARTSNDLILEKDIRQGKKQVTKLKKSMKTKEDQLRDQAFEISVLRKTIDKMNEELSRSRDQHAKPYTSINPNYKYKGQPVLDAWVDEDEARVQPHNTREYYNPSARGYQGAMGMTTKKSRPSRHQVEQLEFVPPSDVVLRPLWTHSGDSVIFNRHVAWFSRKGGGFEKNIKHKQDVYPILPPEEPMTDRRKIEILQADVEYNRELLKQERALGSMPLGLVQAYEEFEGDVRSMFTEIFAIEKEASATGPAEDTRDRYQPGRRGKSRSPSPQPPRANSKGYGPPEPRELSSWRSTITRLHRTVDRLVRDRQALAQTQTDMEQLRRALQAAEARLSVRRVDRGLQTDSEDVLEGLYDDVLRAIITEVATESRKHATGDSKDIKHIPLTIGRFLSKHAKGSTGSLRQPRLVSRELAKIYVAKSKADSADDREGTQRQSWPEFLYDYFIHQYGMQKMAESNLIHFIWSYNSAALERDDAKIFQKLISGAYPPELADFYMHLTRYHDSLKGGMQLTEDDIPMVSIDRVDALIAYALKGLSPQEIHMVEQKMDSIAKSASEELMKKHPLLKKHKIISLPAAFMVINEEWLAEKRRLKTRLERYFKENDKDANGSLSLDEFQELVDVIDSKFSKRKAISMYRAALETSGLVGMDKESFVIFGARHALGSQFKLDLK